MDQPKCKDLVQGSLGRRIEAIKTLWELHYEDPDAYDEDYGNFNEYGLSFDYVPMGTFNDQDRGYFRYQISWGGPSEEFRFYTGPEFEVYDIEFWYLDWFDGACVSLTDEDFELMEEIFEDFKDCGTVERVFNEATEN